MNQGWVVFDRYLLLEQIGAGGTGTVWKATDQRLHQTVALKRISFDGLDDEQAQLTRDRALREARLAAQLRGHPHVIAVYDVQADDSAIWLVMDYLPARSLRELLLAQTRLALDEVVRIGVHLADALAAAHARGIEHRDVKPGNVLIATDGTVKLTDFGISHVTGDPHLTLAGISGTPPTSPLKSLRAVTPRRPPTSFPSAPPSTPPSRANLPLAPMTTPAGCSTSSAAVSSDLPPTPEPSNPSCSACCNQPRTVVPTPPPSVTCSLSWPPSAPRALGHRRQCSGGGRDNGSSPPALSRSPGSR